MRLRCLSIAVCLLLLPLTADAADIPTQAGPAAVSLSDAALPGLDTQVPAGACLADAGERLRAASGPALTCENRCMTVANCPPPPPNCIVGCANRCCIYACEL
jgi:hypothetical protein